MHGLEWELLRVTPLSQPPSTYRRTGTHISKHSPKDLIIADSEMASTMDSHIPQHDDLNLMGLHELDSHLMEFESLGRESSTPGAMSNSAYGDAMSTTENPSTMIVVDSPKENWARKSQPEMLLNGQGAHSRLVSCHILF